MKTKNSNGKFNWIGLIVEVGKAVLAFFAGGQLMN